MRIENAVIVVTGGGSGIGAALCRRFAQERAGAIVVADLAEPSARAVAAECESLGAGHTRSRAARTDVAVGAEVGQLVDDTLRDFGRIDLFCSNAGVALGAERPGEAGGPFAPDAIWQRSWEVNLMAHVHAARAVLPGMLERGSGALLNTASAAGLLTDIGTQAYSVTKHAAVGFAEWLAIRYGDEGIQVACLCPMGVNTPMLAGAGAAGAGAHLVPNAIEPTEVAEAVVRGLEAEHFLILPHPEVAEYEARKTANRDRWLGGMRRMRKRLYPSD